MVSGGFGFPLGAALGAAMTGLAVAAGAPSQPVLSVVGLVVVIDLIGFLSTVRATLATALVCWFLHAGFVLGRLGDLAINVQSRHDALVLGLNALGVILIVSVIRGTPAVQRQPVLMQSQREAH
ncbi:hypothetical protein Lesp02_40140 [Lentzea sp. NBRC 105346]|nr:hypothetical protein Lesp02_40140 [Lentzea sp. NBRC 105346]